MRNVIKVGDMISDRYSGRVLGLLDTIFDNGTVLIYSGQGIYRKYPIAYLVQSTDAEIERDGYSGVCCNEYRY